ncbi:hypothetical protein QFZ37_000391 [Chryseobacterium ginsenosidimutans]|uniref:hypothetical protein n=1 Tax=Chryseobacterium ginsenosidimutans TaxID=687846 RepID=UPI00278A4515|nr:hypothetical protein [Chryseobacterium ginsenosidimutans]MDQ0592022.1 hypothetical protein [Chryseobacterium ginsenosidimutans]
MAENETPATSIAENIPTQTLFRFVSLRSPQLSDEKDQDKRFVFMPEDVKADSQFYFPVKNGAGKKRDLLLAQASIFSASSISKDHISNTLNQFKDDYIVIYNFATWLAKNKSTCTYAEFIAQKDFVIASHNTVYPNLTLLWDNFIYQVVTQKEFYVKEVMMQMILALHTLQTPANNDEETKVLLDARIVLPKEMMMDENSSISFNSSRIVGNQVKETFPSEEMKKQQEISTAKTKLKRIESLKKNLGFTEKQYNKEYQAEYKVQNESYQRQITPIIDEYNAAVAAAKEEYCGIRPPGTEYDPKDPCQQPKEVPYPLLPKFEFNFRDEVIAGNLITSLKPESVETLLDVLVYKFDPAGSAGRATSDDINDLEQALEGRNTFSELTSAINENVERLNNTIIENTQGNEEIYTSIGGIIVPTARTISVPFTYQVCPKFLYKEYVNDLALTVPDATWDVSYISYNLTPNGSSTSIDGDYYVKSRTGNTIFLNDMHSPGVDFSTIQGAILKVKIVFSNGRITEISVPGIQARACSSGKFELEVEEGEPPVIIEDEDNFIPSGFGFKRLGVADYLKVEQSTHAYVEGEVANIENVMAREYREKSTRKLRRSENTTTTSSDSEREQLTDTTTANRYEMQNEISKMMQESTDLGAYANAQMKFSDAYTLGVGANYAHHGSKEESTRQAVTQAQDITSRAMDRIVTKVHEERIEKIIDEFEENNSHGFDNRKGDKHVVGVYRWVDKLMKNQIYNYGKRMMFEFMIPEPAKLHLLGMKNVKTADQTNLVKPEDPRASGNMQISDYSVLSTESKLKYWLSKYNVEIDKKPEDQIRVTKAISINSGEAVGEKAAKSDSIDIPEGYTTLGGWLTAIHFFQPSRFEWTHLSVTVGDMRAAAATASPHIGLDQAISFKNPYSQKVGFACESADTANINISVSLDCIISPEVKNAWLQKTFKAIIDAYEEALVDYNNKLAEEQSKAVEIKDSNPNFYRQIENTVLRKNCISYMADRAVGSTHGYGLSGLTQGNAFIDYETVLSSKLDKYTAFVKFMEQAFEWENLSYYLYPYYWGNKQNWVELYQSENTDPLFRAFLQSGMARVVATVRPGFEDVVQFYLSTGKIWNGGEVPVIGDELYLSIVDEMKEPKGKKEGKAWLTRLPTTLNILQAESIGLKVAHALPFTTENPKDFEVPSEVITEDKFNFEPNSNLLGVQPGEEEEIISGDWE